MKFFCKLTLVLFLLCLLLLCIPSSFALISPSNSSTPKLHVSGNEILDSNNKVVILRGIGRTGDLQSASGMWSGPGMIVASWNQKWQPISSNIPLMDATFQCYAQVWGVNMIRMLIPVNWYWQNNIVPAQQDPNNYGSSKTPISYRTYVTTVVQEAAKYGIYVDICPYELLSNYQDSNAGGAQGLPMSGWDSTAQRFLRSTGLTELNFWKQFWTLMANNLKAYPNAIFEAWNEPSHSGNDNVTAKYMTYLTTMYNAIRKTGAQNLIFMQWDLGYVPIYNDLSWAAQISKAIPRAVNLAFTTHTYRHAPYFNSQWGTDNATVLSQLQTAIQTMGVKAPMVINEAGCCMSAVSSNGIQNELNWWTGLNYAASKLGIGVTAFYWISDSDLGPAYGGQSFLTGAWAPGAASPSPNNVGQIFLNFAKAS